MKEILGHNLKTYFQNYKFDVECRYYSQDYEVWVMYDAILKFMEEEKEESFHENAEEDSWWRYSSGSNIYAGIVSGHIAGREILLWEREDEPIKDNYPNLIEYLNIYMNVSNETNVTALTVDLAKINKIELCELWYLYQGGE